MSSCGGPATTGSAACDGAETVFVNCSGCHDGSAPLSGVLDLRSPAAAVALMVGQPARGFRCAASGAILVDTTGAGLFADKLGPAPPCGDRMPQAARPLSPGEIACVTSWLTRTVTATTEP